MKDYIEERALDSDVDFWVEPDHLSSKIIRMVFSMLIPEYNYDNIFVEHLFYDERFIKLRQEYKNIYGEYSTALVEKYKRSYCKVLEFFECMGSGIPIKIVVEGMCQNHEKERFK